MSDIIAQGLSKGERRWEDASQRLREYGIMRTSNAVNLVWDRELRHPSGLDERVVRRVEGLKTSVQRGKWIEERRGSV
ncbi:MAG: hypothetical protein M1827_001028 [Pycnora praestabilis]|nr:MAG: hypothetical protein M1827_001028 [Pycnora praestabilis]